MNHPCGCETDCAYRDRKRYVQRCCPRRAAQSKVLVPNVRRVSDAAYRPRRQSPCMHVTDGQSKHSADDEVDDAEEKRRGDPCLMTGCVVAHWARI
jgi:hypothetical protein